MGDAFATFASSRVLRLTALMRLRGWLCRESLDSGGDFDEVPRLLLEPQHGFHVFFFAFVSECLSLSFLMGLGQNTHEALWELVVASVDSE